MSTASIQVSRAENPFTVARPIGALGRFIGLTLVVAAILQITASTASAQFVIGQQPGTDFLAFEAEDFFDLNNGDDETGWGIVGITDPFITPAGNLPGGTPVLAEDTTASRQRAIFDFPNGSVNDFVRYRMQFVEAGDYSLYLRYSMFDINNGTSVYGNEDSIYVSSDFGIDGILIDTPADPRGPRDSMPSFYGVLDKGDEVQQGNFGWWNADADDSDPTAENQDAIYTPTLNTSLDFGIAARERGVSIDKVVFHTNPDLSPEELDALPTFAPNTGNPGDYNDDGTVDLADFAIIAENFSLSFPISESFAKGDETRDGKVDLRDFLAARKVFSAPAGAAAAIPEPSGMLLAVLAAALGAITLGRRRRSVD